MLIKAVFNLIKIMLNLLLRFNLRVIMIQKSLSEKNLNTSNKINSNLRNQIKICSKRDNELIYSLYIKLIVINIFNASKERIIRRKKE